MLTTDCPDRAALQSKIDGTLTGFQKKIKRLEALDIPVNFDTLFEVKTAHIAGITIEQGFNEEIERLESLGKIHSATKHRYALQVLEGYKPTSMAIEAIDLDYLKGLELYLRKRGNRDNSIATRFAIFKAIYNKAVKEGRIETKQNPFSLYQVGSLWAKTRKRAIGKEDIQRLIDLEITEGHTTGYRQLAKDLFLFSYFTAGMNFGDMARLRYKDLIKVESITPVTRPRSCYPSSWCRTPCRLSGNTARRDMRKRIISFRFSIAMSIGHHNRFSIGHIRCWEKSIGN